MNKLSLLVLLCTLYNATGLGEEKAQKQSETLESVKKERDALLKACVESEKLNFKMLDDIAQERIASVNRILTFFKVVDYANLAVAVGVFFGEIAHLDGKTWVPHYLKTQIATVMVVFLSMIFTQSAKLTKKTFKEKREEIRAAVEKLNAIQQ